MPKAIRNNVLVKVAEAEEVTTGGLILTAAAVEKPNYGFVKNVGDGYSYPTTGVRVPMVVKEGDCVLYGKYAVDEVEIDEEDHAIISQDAVLAIVDGEYKSENVRPIFDTIFIKRDSTANELSSGIVLTGSKTEKSNIGTIVAVGPGRLMESGETETSPYKVGDTVCFSSSAGTPVKFEGADYLLARVVEILARLE